MEAKIKLTEDEIVTMCERHCNEMFPAPVDKKWVGTFQRFAGVTCDLEDVAIPVSAQDYPVGPPLQSSDSDLPATLCTDGYAEPRESEGDF
jgi:hypothetical protein